MRKKIIILLIILAAVAGGFLYFWYVWLPAQIAKENTSQVSTTTPPTLFGKEDYKIEDRTDGRYIVVPKVGLTAKVPEGWKIEHKKAADVKPQYWITLSSPDAEVFDVITKGCSISITGWESKEYSQNIKKKIETIENTGSKLIEGPDEYKYEYGIISLANHTALKGTPVKMDNKFNKFVKGASVDIVIKDNKILSLGTSYPPAFENKCLLIWNTFIKNLAIK